MTKSLPLGRLRVEQRSRAVLAAWAACCLADSVARTAYPDLGSFGLPLQSADLRCLSLADGLALDALQAVCAYLRARAPSEERPVCFSLRAGDRTAALAEAVAARDAELFNELWPKEQNNAAERERLYFAKVKAKIQEAVPLRKKLADLRNDLEKAQKKYEDASCGETGWYYDSSLGRHKNANKAQEGQYARKQEFGRKVEEAEVPVTATAAKLRAVEMAPKGVVQPLPKAEADALAVLLFLQMDARAPALRVVLKLCFVAAEMLHPYTWEGDKPEANSPEGFDWAAHHADHQNCSYLKLWDDRAVPKGKQGDVRLVASGTRPVPDRHVGPVLVADCKAGDETTCGIWYPVRSEARLLRAKWSRTAAACRPLTSAACTLPPQSGFQLVWRGGVNPFAPPKRTDLNTLFTEEPLPEAFNKDLQWAMAAGDPESTESSTRGSRAVATHGARPPSLTKAEYEALGALRADSRVELRTLCAALRERSLPLGHEAAQLVIRQLLYSVGPLSAGKPGCFPAPPVETGLSKRYLESILGKRATDIRWKAELAVRGRGSLMGTLQQELSGLADELRDRVSDHAALLPIIDLAVYLSRWRADSPDAADVRWNYVDVVERRAPLLPCRADRAALIQSISRGAQLLQDYLR